MTFIGMIFKKIKNIIVILGGRYKIIRFTFNFFISSSDKLEHSDTIMSEDGQYCLILEIDSIS